MLLPELFKHMANHITHPVSKQENFVGDRPRLTLFTLFDRADYQVRYVTLANSMGLRSVFDQPEFAP